MIVGAKTITFRPHVFRLSDHCQLINGVLFFFYVYIYPMKRNVSGIINEKGKAYLLFVFIYATCCSKGLSVTRRKLLIFPRDIRVHLRCSMGFVLLDL